MNGDAIAREIPAAKSIIPIPALVIIASPKIRSFISHSSRLLVMSSSMVVLRGVMVCFLYVVLLSCNIFRLSLCQ